MRVPRLHQQQKRKHNHNNRWQALGPEFDPGNHWQWRHDRSGGHPSWELQFERSHGIEWKSLAADREPWRQLEPHFVRSALKVFKVSSKVVNWSTLALPSISEPRAPFVLPDTMPPAACLACAPLHIRTWTLIVFGDSELIINAVGGNSSCGLGLRAMRGRVVDMVRLLHRFGVQPLQGSLGFFKSVPRVHNAEADALANQALDDDKSTVHVFADRWTAVASMTDVLLEVGFDGAARGNPSGPASAGFWVKAWRGRCEGYLLKGSLLLGVASNNEAEMSSVCTVMRLLIDQLRLACS